MTRTAKAIVVLAAVLLVVGLLWLRSCQEARTAKTQADLAKGQAGAALQSGTDAVQTLGNESARAAEIHDTVKEGTDAIQSAPAGNSNDAADRASCRMHSYRHLPRCVALLGPAPE